MKRLALLLILLTVTSQAAVNITTHVPLADSAGKYDTSYAPLLTFVDNHAAAAANVAVSDSMAASVLYSWLFGVMDTSSAVLQTQANVAVSDSTAAMSDSSIAANRAWLLFGLQGTYSTFGRMHGDSLYVDTAHIENLSATTLTGLTQLGTNTDIIFNASGVVYFGIESDTALATKKIAAQKIAGDSAQARATAANVRDSLYAHNKFQLVEMTTVHNPRYARTNNDTLMLEDAIGDTAFFDWRVVGGAANQAGVVYMTAVLPWGVTKLDTVCINYLSSSATAATSSIDSMEIWVTTNAGKTAPTAQAYNPAAVDLAATGSNQYLWVINDLDFNGGERVIIKFYTYVDEDEWVGVRSCALRCEQ
jgi:hypothetical protein